MKRCRYGGWAGVPRPLTYSCARSCSTWLMRAIPYRTAFTVASPSPSKAVYSRWEGHIWRELAIMESTGPISALVSSPTTPPLTHCCHSSLLSLGPRECRPWGRQGSRNRMARSYAAATIHSSDQRRACGRMARSQSQQARPKPLRLKGAILIRGRFRWA